MAFEIPSQVLPVLQALGIRWPDINEDDVFEMGLAFDTFGSSVQCFGWPVAGVLHELNRANSSQTLQHMVDYWSHIQTNYLDTFYDLTAQVMRYCTDGYNAIHTYKAALLGQLTFEGGADTLGIIATGGLALVLDPAIEQAVKYAVLALLEEVINKIQAAILRPLQHLLDRDLDGLVNKALALGESAAYAELSHAMPTAEALAAEGDLSRWAGDLHVSLASLETSARHIEGSLEEIGTAAKKLVATVAKDRRISPLSIAEIPQVSS